MRALRIALGIGALCALAAPGRADDGEAFEEFWAPAGITSTTEPPADVLALMRNSGANPPLQNRVDHYALTAGDHTYAVTVRVLGGDYAISSSILGEPIRLGRSAWRRWRANGNTVHVVGADVQGDDFDRWPVAALGFAAGDCTLAGEARIPEAAWVLFYHPLHDIPRWLYVDERDGEIVREISREGGRVVTYALTNDGRTGERRPIAWRITGDGGTALVALTERNEGGVTAADVMMPEQGPPAFATPSAATGLDANVTDYDVIRVPVRVNGHERLFQLDSGTPELILNANVSRAAGGSELAHGVAASLEVAGGSAGDVPFREVGFWLDGLLGYDFFRGRIVHVDYRNHRVEVLPRETFSPPAGATALPTDWSEGMPLIEGRIGTTSGNRFALDLGSSDLVILRRFAKRASLAADGRFTYLSYLEGPVTLRSATIDGFQFATFKVTRLEAHVEQRDPKNLDIPLDGIVGTRVLGSFEWWFDADGPVTYVRPN